MKKLLLICLAILPLCFASCEKEYNYNLNGTLWKHQYDYDSTQYYIEFVGKNKVIAFIDDYQYDEGTYKQKEDKITFYDLEVAEGFGRTQVYKSAVQTNNTLIVTYASRNSSGELGSEDKRLYIKQ